MHAHLVLRCRCDRENASYRSFVQAFTPQAAYLQGRQCDLQLTVNVTNETPGVPVDTSLTESSTAISISGTTILGVDGEEVHLKGLSFFGYDQQASKWDDLVLSLGR